MCLFAHTHQDDVDSQPVQPCREGRFPAERVDFAKDLQEDILGQVFGFG